MAKYLIQVVLHVPVYVEAETAEKALEKYELDETRITFENTAEEYDYYVVGQVADHVVPHIT